MSDATLVLQTALVAALSAHPVLSQSVTGVYDGPPARPAFPYIVIGDGPVSDWSTKTATGREIRLSLNVWDDGEEATRLHQLIGHVEDAVSALPRNLPGWRVVSNIFLRSLLARDPAGPWAGLVEFRVRLLSQ
jgi:hypothetical protein